MFNKTSFLPSSIKFSLKAMLLAFSILFIYRLFIFYWFKPAEKALSGSMLLMGARFDARVCAMLALVSLLFYKVCITKKWSKPKLLSALMAIVFTIIALACAVDFFYYDYLQQRLSASILNFVADANISAKMVIETYPVVSGSIGLLITSFLFYVIFKGISQVPVQECRKSKLTIVSIVIFFIGCTLFIFGRIGQYPLRWSDAFTLSDEFKANAALNPFQSFVSTLKFRKERYNTEAAKKAYPIVANYFGVTPNDKFSLHRAYKPVANNTIKPNIVVVICESFSAYKSSMYGNKLNTTPYFNTLCNQGAFFTNCYTPSYGTAKGVWAVLTGMPDVAKKSTASRNPAMVNQQCIFNEFAGYEKMYFLGGSTTWANIRGVLTNNITGLKIYEQENFKAKQVDVWGVSDKNLFLEANNILSQQTKPFVSVIQTADNHRPYTIPKEDAATFKIVSYPKDTLVKYGFDSNEQLNAFRYSDFCFETFMNAAKKGAYFSNTIFIFVGDHGLRGDAKDMFAKTYTSTGIAAEHVPLLFYGPKLIKPSTISTPASQLDVFATAAGLANINYTNTSFGADLFNDSTKKPFAFINDPDEQTISLVGKEYLWQKHLPTNKETFVYTNKNENVIKNTATDSIQQYMKQHTEALYNFAHYLLLNNKKLPQ
jgi:phosphoglycerol transferase MdoB-like AlkP superfamily enzyme